MSVQVCWEKFTRYFDVEEKFVHLTEGCYVLTPEKAIALVDENTIGACPAVVQIALDVTVVTSLSCTYCTACMQCNTCIFEKCA